MAIEIVDFPMKIAWWIFPLRTVNVYKRVKKKENTNLYTICIPKHQPVSSIYISYINIVYQHCSTSTILDGKNPMFAAEPPGIRPTKKPKRNPWSLLLDPEKCLLSNPNVG